MYLISCFDIYHLTFLPGSQFIDQCFWSDNVRKGYKHGLCSDFLANTYPRIDIL